MKTVCKKCLTALILMAFVVVGAFAQNDSYKDFVKKAKDAEAKSEWAYAMGYYVDAIYADPDYASEVSVRLDEIKRTIQSGNPGFKAAGGKFTVFEMYESWKNLLMNAEKYWTEYCPYEIMIHPLEMGTPNYANKTAEYKAKIEMRDSEKFAYIMEALMDGYSVAYKSDWSDMPAAKKYQDTVRTYDNYNDELNKYVRYYDYGSYRNLPPLGSYYLNNYNWWPMVSVTKVPNATKSSWTSKIESANKGTDYSLVKDKAQYNKSGAAVYGYPANGNQYYEKDSKTGKRGYNDYAIGEYYNPWFVATHSDYTGRLCYMYDLKVKIVDEKGNVIAASKRFMPNQKDGDFYYTGDDGMEYVSFPGITQAQMALIDGGKAWVEVESVLLQYGFQSNGDLNAYRHRDYPSSYALISEDPFYFKKNLPEISVDMSKVNVLNLGHDEGKVSLEELMKAIECKNFIDQYGYTVSSFELDDANLLAVLAGIHVDNRDDYYSLEYSGSYKYFGDNKLFKGMDSYFYGWQLANMFSVAYGLPEYYKNGYSNGTTGGFFYPEYSTKEKYSNILDSISNPKEMSILIAFIPVPEEQKAERLANAVAKGEALLKSVEEKMTSYGNAFDNDDLAKTFEEYKSSVAALKTALSDKKSVSKINIAIEEVKAIDLENLDKRYDYLSQLDSDARALLDEANAKYEKALPVLGADGYAMKRLREYSVSLESALKRKKTSSIKTAYENLSYWLTENGGAIDESVASASEIVKNIDAYYLEQRGICNEYRKILGQDYSDSNLKGKEKALDVIVAGIDAKDTPKIVNGYNDCQRYNDLSKVEAAANDYLDKAKAAPDYWKEMDEHCKELRSVLGSWKNSSLDNMELNLANLKNALDKEDIPAINKYYMACKGISLYAAENQYDKVLKDAAAKNKADADKARKRLSSCDTALALCEMYLIEKSANKNDVAALKDKLGEIASVITGNTDDAAVAAKLSDLESIYDQIEVVLPKIEVETATNVLEGLGITLVEQKGSIGLFYNDGRSSSYTHNFTTDKVKVYAVTLNKKGSFTKSTKMKASDYLIFDTGAGTKAEIKNYKLKSGDPYVPQTFDAFIQDVLKARNGGTFTILYVHKAMGSYDGYVETVTVPAKK